MYKVKVDEKLLCFTGSVNGMEYVTDPDVKLVVNGVDSFSFAIYPQHPLYKEIACKVSRVKIWRDSKLLFYGEVTGYSQDMYGIRTYDCEGALAWLNDLHFAYSISGATPKDVLYWYIKMYNQKLRDKSKSFELGTVTVHRAMTQDGTEGTIARSSGVYPSFWEEIQDKLLNSFGGILRVRYVGSDTCAGYIDWLAIPDGTCTQDVRYAKNLLNCDWTYDCTSIATAVVPLGKRKDSSGDNEVRLTIDKADDDDATFMIQYMTGTDDLVKYGNMVYSKSRMEKYGLIQQAVTFDDVTDTGTLAYQGAVWLRQNGKASSTISAEAIDLADIDESVEHFTLGDYVRTKLPSDIAENLFPITAIEIPIAAPENAKLTVGTQESSITSGSGGQGGGSITNAGSGADAMAHTHSNKGVLDKITEQDYADFKGAVNKAHIHANKDTLDKIEQPYTTAERDKLAWLENYTHPTHTAHAKGFYKFASDGEGHVTDVAYVDGTDMYNLGCALRSDIDPSTYSGELPLCFAKAGLDEELGTLKDCVGGLEGAAYIRLSKWANSHREAWLIVGGNQGGESLGCLCLHGKYSFPYVIKPPSGEDEADGHTYTLPAGKDGTFALTSDIPDISGKLDKTGDASTTTVALSAASARENIKTGEKLSV
ncbi:phage tail protein, partial [uncultured Ruminococcus sp.]|uniref:phage tail protein n=1 Tax=uncultured Ruminococcus sp. TaxID=165186 RepID=UPI002676AAE0